MEYKQIRAEREDSLGLIFLDRPKVLNALTGQLIAELLDCLKRLDREEGIRVIILTGNEKAFAAGADIGAMSQLSSVDLLVDNPFGAWDAIHGIEKPIIAAVSGFALGEGCELAMACDMIVASETAHFGQPEITLGVIPGAGGTQMLPRTIGKYKAMEVILGGEQMGAEEAYRRGLVNRVVPVELFLEEAKRLGREIASKPPLAVKLAKQAIRLAFETSLDEGLKHERKNFYLLFSTSDQKEGMKAFLEKRKPRFTGR
jgi:enoyl-CoA hydratase